MSDTPLLSSQTEPAAEPTLGRSKRKRGLLRRQPRGRWIGGVCTGIAEWLGWNVTLTRILFVIGSVFPIIPGFVVYAILWLLVPMADAAPPPSSTN